MSKIQKIITVGEILVEFVSHRTGCGLSKIGDYSGPYPSGAPAIFLDQAARMGAQTQMIGGVGNDGFGHITLARLKEDGVGIDGVTVCEDHSTGVAFVSYYEDGNRDFIFHLTNTAADQFDLPQSLPDLSQTLLHISASSLGNDKIRDMVMTLVRDVDHAGGKVSCDPNARPELMRNEVVRTAMQHIMERSYCLMPSTSDLDFLFPELSEDQAVAKMLEAKAEVIVVKRGAQGATVVADGMRHDFSGHNVEEIDPTGAGDCFCGTFISLLTQGISLNEAGQRANAAGAIAVTRRGPMEGNSTPDEISAFLEKSERIKVTA